MYSRIVVMLSECERGIICPSCGHVLPFCEFTEIRGEVGSAAELVVIPGEYHCQSCCADFGVTFTDG